MLNNNKTIIESIDKTDKIYLKEIGDQEEVDFMSDYRHAKMELALTSSEYNAKLKDTEDDIDIENIGEIEGLSKLKVVDTKFEIKDENILECFNIENNIQILNDLLNLKKPKLYQIGASFFNEPLSRNIKSKFDYMFASSTAMNYIITTMCINNYLETTQVNGLMHLDFIGAPKWMIEKNITKIILYTLRSIGYNSHIVKDDGKEYIYISQSVLDSDQFENKDNLGTYVKGLIISNVNGKEKMTIHSLSLAKLYREMDTKSFLSRRNKILSYLELCNVMGANIDDNLKSFDDFSASSKRAFARILDEMVDDWYRCYIGIEKGIADITDEHMCYPSSSDYLMEMKIINAKQLRDLDRYFEKLNDSKFWLTEESEDLIKEIDKLQIKLEQRVKKYFKQTFFKYISIDVNLAHLETRTDKEAKRDVVL